MIFDLNNILDEETRKRNDSLETEASSQRSRTVSTGSTCSMSNVSTYSEDFTGDGNSQYNDTIKVFILYILLNRTSLNYQYQVMILGISNVSFRRKYYQLQKHNYLIEKQMLKHCNISGNGQSK